MKCLGLQNAHLVWTQGEAEAVGGWWKIQFK